MKIVKNQQGFGTVEILILGVVIIAIAGVGYVVLNRQNSKLSNSPSAKPAAVETKMPDKITSKSDLIKAGKALDQQQIDAKLDPNQLNQDIKSLL
jgi:hypothetical protein